MFCVNLRICAICVIYAQRLRCSGCVAAAALQRLRCSGCVADTHVLCERDNLRYLRNLRHLRPEGRFGDTLVLGEPENWRYWRKDGTWLESLVDQVIQETWMPPIGRFNPLIEQCPARVPPATPVPHALATTGRSAIALVLELRGKFARWQRFSNPIVSLAADHTGRPASAQTRWAVALPHA
jgi:hypothetical protein